MLSFKLCAWQICQYYSSSKRCPLSSRARQEEAECWLAEKLSDTKVVGEFEDKAALAWLYGLAARAPKPLSAEVSAQMYSFFNKGAKALTQIEEQYDDCIPSLSVVLCIAGAYFRQDESMVGLCPDEYD